MPLNSGSVIHRVGLLRNCGKIPASYSGTIYIDGVGLGNGASNKVCTCVSNI